MKSDDLISISALLRIINSMTFDRRFSLVKHLIEATPTIDAEPVRHGYWIPQDNTYTKFMCSDCKGRNHDGSGKYCSECGCKMDAEVSE